MHAWRAAGRWRWRWQWRQVTEARQGASVLGRCCHEKSPWEAASCRRGGQGSGWREGPGPGYPWACQTVSTYGHRRLSHISRGFESISRSALSTCRPLHRPQNYTSGVTTQLEASSNISPFIGLVNTVSPRPGHPVKPLGDGLQDDRSTQVSARGPAPSSRSPRNCLRDKTPGAPLVLVFGLRFLTLSS